MGLKAFAIYQDFINIIHKMRLQSEISHNTTIELDSKIADLICRYFEVPYERGARSDWWVEYVNDPKLDIMHELTVRKDFRNGKSNVFIKTEVVGPVFEVNHEHYHIDKYNTTITIFDYVYRPILRDKNPDMFWEWAILQLI